MNTTHNMRVSRELIPLLIGQNAGWLLTSQEAKLEASAAGEVP